MNQTERRLFLIKHLLSEKKDYAGTKIPDDEEEQKVLLRALMNVRLPKPISESFLKIQDEYLTERKIEKGVVPLDSLTFHGLNGIFQNQIAIWQGDITRIATDAIVNAANSEMTGCYGANHACIDNAIHTYAGIQLRLECAELMKKQGHEEPTGDAKITAAYNLPSKYVIHTVGPIVQGKLETRHIVALKSCYKKCLEVAVKNNCNSIVFCCISTGVFMFPNEKAAEIAVNTVKDFLIETKSTIKVVFNVFKDKDFEIYERMCK